MDQQHGAGEEDQKADDLPVFGVPNLQEDPEAVAAEANPIVNHLASLEPQVTCILLEVLMCGRTSRPPRTFGSRSQLRLGSTSSSIDSRRGQFESIPPF
jgi:hypothetical protein